MSELEKITLENLGAGAAIELFNRELTEVIKNIEDVNIPAKVAREINLKIIITPTEQRDSGFIEIKCSSKIVGTKGLSVPIMFGTEKGKTVIYQMIPEQGNLDLGQNVSPIGKGTANA
jgi:hypothetical protein